MSQHTSAYVSIRKHTSANAQSAQRDSQVRREKNWGRQKKMEPTNKRAARSWSTQSALFSRLCQVLFFLSVSFAFSFPFSLLALSFSTQKIFFISVEKFEWKLQILSYLKTKTRRSLPLSLLASLSLSLSLLFSLPFFLFSLSFFLQEK